MRAAKEETARHGEEKTYNIVAGTTRNTKKSVATKEIIQKHSKDFGGTLAGANIIRLCGIARNTYYRYKRQLRAEG